MLIQAETNKDKFKFLHAQHIGSILDGNKELAKEDGWSKDKGMRHLARIPNLTFYKMIQKYPGINDGDNASKQKELYKALHDPEFEIFRLRHE